MRRRVSALLVLSLFALAGRGAGGAERPRLVVVVSVDQLAYEYLDRFRAGMADDGFFRQVERSGAWYTEAHHRQAYTVTAPGHAVLMTGAYPNSSGIVGNDWYDRRIAKSVYCVEDAEYPIVGAPPSETELKGVSPRKLQAETLGDVLKRETGGRAKVFGVTLKDRAAVLMTGAKADGAYWFDGKSGCWVTSRYYRPELPDYIQKINAGETAEQYAGKSWELLHDIARYRLYYPDENAYEGDYEQLGKSFPHHLEKEDLTRLRKQIACTPFGNELTLQLAEQIIVREELGKDEVTDVLAVGFSSNDYVGHTFGPHSLEVEDMTYRTDLVLAQLVRLLDQHVGAGRWTLALSSDHGVSPIPEYAATTGLSAQRNPLGDVAKLREQLEARLIAKFGELASGEAYIERLDSHQLFLRGDDATDRFAAIQRETKEFLLEQPGVSFAVTRHELLSKDTSPLPVRPEFASLIPPGSEPLTQFRLTFNVLLGGDVLIALRPFSIQGTTKASHGTPWVYDTHIPVMFLGQGIRQTRCGRPVSPAAIGVTFAKLLEIPAPAQNVEQPLVEAL